MKRLCIMAAAAVSAFVFFSCQNTSDSSSADSSCKYTVEHYKELLDGAFPEKADKSEVLEGVRGGNASYVPQLFEGFTNDSSLTVVSGSSGSAGKACIDADTVVRLYYRRNAVTLQFNLDGGTTATSLQDGKLSGRYGETLSVAAPQKDGRNFVRWVPEVPGSFPAENMLYTALWDAVQYTVTFHPNGSTGKEYTQAYAGGASLHLIPAAYLRDHYVFSGWNTKADGSGIQYADRASIEGLAADTDLFAQWSLASYPVVYELNGGTNSAANPQAFTYEDELQLSDPSRAGYTFSGWYAASDFSGNQVTQILRHTSGEMHVYARWTGIKHTLTFKSNNSESAPPYTQEILYGTAEKLLPAQFTLFGADFAGWNTETNGKGTAYADQADFAIGMEDTKLYAQWRFIKYTITYDTDGGALDAGTITEFFANSDSRITLKGAVKDGYTFSYWKDDQGRQIGTLIKSYIQDKRTFHLTAVWKVKK